MIRNVIVGNGKEDRLRRFLALTFLGINLVSAGGASAQNNGEQMPLNKALSSLAVSSPTVGDRLSVSLQIGGRVENLDVLVKDFKPSSSGGQVKGVLPGFGRIIATAGPNTMNIRVSGAKGIFEYSGRRKAEYPLLRPISTLRGNDIPAPIEPLENAVEKRELISELEQYEK